MKYRKIISAVLAASIFGATALTTSVCANDDKLLFAVDFDNQSVEAKKGLAELNGTLTYQQNEEGYAAVFDGASFIEAKNEDSTPLLKGKDRIVVTMKAKTERGSTNGWYFYTSPDTSVQERYTRTYAGVLNNYTDVVTERFWSNSGTPTVTTPSTLDQWQDITLVIADKKQELYIDGSYMGTAEYAFTLSELLGNGDDIITYIGRGNWGINGEYFKGEMDDVEIYDFAPNIELEQTRNITEDITLPTADLGVDGYSVQWTSSDEDIISNDGRVTRPEAGIVPVTLTANIAFGENGKHKLTRDIEVTVEGWEKIKTEIRYISVSAQEGRLFYEVGNSHKKDERLYTAIYKDDGTLLQCDIDKESGSIPVEDGRYTVKAFIWDDMTPCCDSKERVIEVKNRETQEQEILWRSTTEDSLWVDKGILTATQYTKSDSAAQNYINVNQDIRYQLMDEEPWGGCFNDRGQMAMNMLPEDEQMEIIEALFGDDGLRFGTARLPLGNSDYSDTHKSYDEIDGDADYDMEHFSIATDEQYLLPYIKKALKVNPDIKFFSTPWSPPSWMKFNKRINGVDDGNKINFTPENLSAYAKYFVKYLEAYSKEGINVEAVTPQNEPTMNTAYSSCVWTGEQLNEFIRDYLYPAITEYNRENDKAVEVWLGTFTDSQESWCMPTLQDETTLDYIKAVCFQWWGAPLATTVHRTYKDLMLVQSETKCGDGRNNWRYAEEQFDCFKEFLDAGVSRYYLWNMVLDEKGANTAARPWYQNAPVTVNSTTGEVSYNPSYYLTKHFSYYIGGGAGRINITGNFAGNAIAFQNTDGENVLVVRNSSDRVINATINFNGYVITPAIPAHSINTFRCPGIVTATEDATYTESGNTENAVRISLINSEGKLLSVENASLSNLANIVKDDNHGESYQIWRLVPTDDGYYNFYNTASEKVIAVNGGSTADGAAVIQWTREDGDDQRWVLVPVTVDDKTYYWVKNKKSEKCLTINSDGKAAIQPYMGDDSQLWELKMISGELF